jgi:hypothetical protein
MLQGDGHLFSGRPGITDRPLPPSDPKDWSGAPVAGRLQARPYLPLFCAKILSGPSDRVYNGHCRPIRTPSFSSAGHFVVATLFSVPI